MAKSNTTPVLRKTVREYNTLRAEILTWIQVEYTLIAASATVTLVALAFFKEAEHWFLFSSVLLGILATLIGLTSFARAKIMQVSSYLIVFHNEPFEQRMLVHQESKGYRLTTTLHKLSLVSLYILLGVSAVGYPLILAIKANVNVAEARWFVGSILAVAIGLYFTALYCCGLSYQKRPHVDHWKNVQFDENQKRKLAQNQIGGQGS